MTNKLRSVQGLRGLSIAGVFMSHWYAGASSSGLMPSHWMDTLAWLNLGKYGVELFFMISGFVIASSLVRHGSILSFSIDRVARIYPTFAAMHLLVFLTGPFVHYKLLSDISLHEWLTMFWANALLLPGVFDFPIAQTVAWSLSYEVLFYALAAATYACLKRQSTGVAIGLAMVGGVLFVSAHPRALYFLPGIAAYFAFNQKKFTWRVPDSVAASAFCLFLLLWSDIHPEDGKTLWQAVSADQYAWVSCTISLFCASLFFFSVLLGEGYLHKAFGFSWLVRLGDLSYSFYLLHVLIMFPVKRLISSYIQPHLGSATSFLVFGILSFLITLWTARWSRQWLELQAGDIVKRWLHHRLQAHAKYISK